MTAVITVRPADLLGPAYEKMKAEAEKAGLIKKEEDVLTYILYPAIAPAFLKGRKNRRIFPKSSSSQHRREVFPTRWKWKSTVRSSRSVSYLLAGISIAVAGIDAAEDPRGDVAGGIRSNMQGMVLKVMVSRSAAVKKGDTLLVLEAMKMENPIHSPVDGNITEIFVDNGDTVQNGDVLMVVQ